MESSSLNYGSLGYGSSFPHVALDGVGALDTFPINTSSDYVTSQDMNLVQDAILNIEQKLGINGSAVNTTIDYILKNTTNGHDHDGTDSKRLTGLTATHFTSLNGSAITNLTPENIVAGNITVALTFDALATFDAGITVNGNIVVTGTVDGVDVSALATTVSAHTASIAALEADVNGFPDELKNLTTAEIQQVENIDVTTISAASWGFVGSLNQALATTSSPTFNSLTVTNNIVVGGTVDGRNVSNDGATLDAIPATYLALAGGTMTGQLNITNAIKIVLAGAAAGGQIYLSASKDLYIHNTEGDLQFEADGGDAHFRDGTVIRAWNAGTTANLNFTHNVDGAIATTSGSINLRPSSGALNVVQTGTNTQVSFYNASNNIAIDIYTSSTHAFFRSNTGQIYFEPATNSGGAGFAQSILRRGGSDTLFTLYNASNNVGIELYTTNTAGYVKATSGDLWLLSSGGASTSIIFANHPRNSSGVYTQQNVRRESGWGYIVGDGGISGMTEAVTFQRAFSNDNVRVFVTSLGGRTTAAGAPTDEGDFTGFFGFGGGEAAAITSSGFTVHCGNIIGASSAAIYWGYAWEAEGPV